MTTPAFPCLLLTSDPQLTQQLIIKAGSLAEIRETASRLDWARQRSTPPLRLLDLRHPEAAAALADADQELRSEIIVFGVPESAPFLACHDAGLFSTEPLDVEPERLRRTIRHAGLLHQAQEELSLLREQNVPDMVAQPPANEQAMNLAPLYELWRAARHFHDIPKLLDQLVDGVAAAGRIARVGVFARLHDEPTYRLWSGLRCLDNTETITFEPLDLFVHWLERHAHLVCRAHLNHVHDLRNRRLLYQVLDDLGAEIILPLLSKRGLLGWIFVGHRVTGIPFTQNDLANLTVISEHVATLLENALLVEELTVQKTLAENLLEALPIGVLAVSEEGLVRWFNSAAETILDMTAAETINRPIEKTCSRLSDMLLRTMPEDTAPLPAVWTDPASRRTIRAVAYRISNSQGYQGSMLLLTDITSERLLQEKQAELERHTFWNDLAAAMSHEIRNPLVAISTFAQLLPERYADPDFRQQFFDIVTGEVVRLNDIIKQINSFAHPPLPRFSPVAPAEIARQACERAAQIAGKEKSIVQCEIDTDLPPLVADTDALADALTQILVNAYEAVQAKSSPQIHLYVRRTGAEPTGALLFAVVDNGPGITPELQAKLFSPFSTTKPRGLGLGMPLAGRTATDHNGRIDVDSNEQGTTVTITLPLAREQQHPPT